MLHKGDEEEEKVNKLILVGDSGISGSSLSSLLLWMASDKAATSFIGVDVFEAITGVDLLETISAPSSFSGFPSFSKR